VVDTRSQCVASRRLNAGRLNYLLLQPTGMSARARAASQWGHAVCVDIAGNIKPVDGSVAPLFLHSISSEHMIAWLVGV